MIVRNIGKSPRGIRNKDGRVVVIPPGGEKEIDLDDAGIAWCKSSENLSVDKVEAKVDDDSSKVESRDNLIKRAEKLGIKVNPRWGEKRIRKEIKDHAV